METIVLLITFLLALVVGFAIKPKPVYASSDGTSSAYGFTVDNEFYDVKWNGITKALYLKIDGKQIGEVDINVGKAVSKEKFADTDKYLITYMVRAKTISDKATYTESHRFLWWTWTSSYNRYGWFKDITLTSTLNSGTTLHDSYPKYTASDTGYSLGANIGVSSSGVSGGYQCRSFFHFKSD